MNNELALLIFRNKRLRLMLFLLALFLFLLALFSSLTNGYITVNTNDQNNVISLIRISKNNGVQKTISFVQGRHFRASVPGGNYEISVTNKASSISKYIVVRAPHSKTYELDIPSPVDPESVLPSGALSLAANSDSMLYLDYSTKNLYSLDANGLPVVLDQDVHFTSINWASTSFGVGQADDKRLYVIQNGSVSLLAVPFAYGSASIGYSVSSTGMIYVSSGSAVYAGQYGTSFKKFFTASSGDLSLFAGKNNLAIIESDKTNSGETGPKEEDKSVLIINAKGDQTASAKLDVGSLNWSIDGDKIVATNSAADHLTIYNLSLGKIAAVAADTDTVTWLDDNTLVYGQSVNLWRYNVNTGESSIISSTPSKESVFNVFLSDDRSYVYFTGENPSNFTHILLRSGLTPAAQDTSSYYSALSVAFPQQSTECNIGYAVFKNANIIISGWRDQDFCHGQAQVDLQNYGLPLSVFNIVFAGTNNYDD